ncbi:MAG: hypothetical protein JWR19_2202 [Pedosphaera sp.]|nr:hypothetical protein [Pedosphaera sp.]
MNTPPTVKTRKPKAIKRLGKFEDGAKPVKVHFEIKSKEICFRKCGSRKVLKITLRDVYEKITGQIVMPFV